MLLYHLVPIWMTKGKNVGSHITQKTKGFAWFELICLAVDLSPAYIKMLEAILLKRQKIDKTTLSSYIHTACIYTWLVVFYPCNTKYAISILWYNHSIGIFILCELAKIYKNIFILHTRLRAHRPMNVHTCTRKTKILVTSY